MMKELKESKVAPTERMKTVGASWKSLTKEEKKPYEDQAAIEKAAYGERKKQYVIDCFSLIFLSDCFFP
jgi:hypothetical protein